MFDILASLIIILSRGGNWLIAVPVLILIKDGCYSWLRVKYTRQKSSFLLMGASVTSVVVVAQILSEVNRWVIVVFHVTNGFLHLIVYSLLIYWSHRMWKYDKMGIVTTTESEANILQAEIAE